MSKWRRPATKVYDYNTRFGEHYYKPQLDYLDTRKGREKTPPHAKTFAERYAADPIYGSGRGPNLRKSAYDLDNSLGEGGEQEPSRMSKFASMEDMSLGNKKRPSDLDRAFSPTSPRLIVGDRLLDALGVQESKLSQPLTFLSSFNAGEEKSSALSATSTRRKVGFAQSAQADLVSEDPLRSRLSAKYDAARKKADEMVKEMNQENETTSSRFLARVKQRRAEEQTSNKRELVSTSYNAFTDDDDETADIRSRVNAIGERARARLLALDEDFPEIQITSSLAARRAGGASSFYDDVEDDSSSAAKTTSRSLKVTKRSLKASYEME